MEVKLVDLVRDGKKVKFQYYRGGELIYATECGFEFPVPIKDAGTGIFKNEDKAILFMRWIRPHIEEVNKWKTEAKLSGSNSR